MLSPFIFALGNKGLFFCELWHASHLGASHYDTGDLGSIPSPGKLGLGLVE